MPTKNEIILILSKNKEFSFFDFKTANNPPIARESICEGNNITLALIFPPKRIVITLNEIEAMIVRIISFNKCLSGIIKIRKGHNK